MRNWYAVLKRTWKEMFRFFYFNPSLPIFTIFLYPHSAKNIDFIVMEASTGRTMKQFCFAQLYDFSSSNVKIFTLTRYYLFLPYITTNNINSLAILDNTRFNSFNEFNIFYDEELTTWNMYLIGSGRRNKNISFWIKLRAI